MGKAIRYLVLVALVLVGAATFIQYWITGVTIPDVRGMSIPQAEAALNAAGLRLGAISTVDDDDASGTLNTVVEQSFPALLRLPPGSTIDLTVLRNNNVLLRYDMPTREEAVGNTLTGRWFNLQNLTNDPLYIDDLSFVSVQDEAIRLDAESWGWRLEEIAGGYCLQILPDPLNFPISVSGCEAVPEFGWFYSDEPSQQFWVGGESFYVYQGSALRGTCQIAEDTCELWIEARNDDREITPYFYFVYDQERFAVFNRTVDRWMPIDEIDIAYGGGSLNLGREEITALEPFLSVDLGLLAPDQCLLFSTGSAAAPFPGCVQVIGEQRGAAPFWRDGFRVGGETCPPASADGTLCLVPRG